MLDFIYNTPTTVYFGKGMHSKVGSIIQNLGYKKIMLQYGKGSIKKSGLYDEIMLALKNSNIEVVEMGGVEPNPKVEFVRNAVQVAKKEKVELILAVGGGSVIDSSKCTALGAKSDYDIWDLCLGKQKPQDALPVGCILTISAAGSEMSNSAVLTNLSENRKKGCTTEYNRCKFAILNPELTYSVSPYQTGCGIVDMMTHTMERYFTPVPPTDLTDRVAEGILRAIVLAGEKVIENPCDYEARATLMWGSSLAHNGLTSCGRENYLLVHQLEHAISGFYDEVAHGAGLAVVYPAWAKYVYKHNVKRFAGFAKNVFAVSGKNDEESALLGIEKMQEFFTKLNMPSKLSDFNIGEEMIDKLAEKTTLNGSITLNSYIPLTTKEVKEIFKLCY